MPPASTLDLDFRWLGRVDFRETLTLQENLAGKRLAGEIPDTVLLLEHQPVYTIGRTRDQSSLLNPNALPHPVVEINRGGQATYHGPGQLVGYPILDLTGFGRDLHRYLRALENTLISLCGEFAVDARRRDGLTGVWTGHRKIASLGVGVKKWISMHGFALNVCGDLDPFASIVPCGIDGVLMTNLEKETGTSLDLPSIAKAVRPHLVRELDRLRGG